MKTVLAILCAAAMSLGSASAQLGNSLGASTAGDPMFYNFDYQNVAPLLSSFGYTHEQTSMNGHRVYRVSDGNVVMVLLPTACQSDNGTNCVGLAIMALFEAPLSESLNNEFNNSTFFLHAENQNGNTVLERYLISDFGFSKRTLEVELSVFSAVVGNYARFRTGYLQTVDFSPEEKPVLKGKIGNAMADGEMPSAPAGSRTHLRATAIAAYPAAFNDYVAFEDLVAQ